MGPALQVEAVQGEVKAVEALVNEWANKSLQTSNNTTQNHLVALKQAKDCMQQLKETEAEMSEKATLLEKRLAHEHAEVQQLTETLEKVQGIEKSLPPQIDAMKENISSLQQKANTAKQGIELSLQEKKALLENLQTIKVDFFRNRLGLRFDRSVSGVLRLVFTHIDKNDHNREFAIGIQVLDDTEQLYVVRECSPQVAGLDDLLATLNETNDLQAFVLAVRGKFKQLVEAQPGSEQ
uniref:Kinetochore protein SPC25 n=1 Tax=Pyramimonas obovata TaxID=1411642 RepID=A0A7S0N2N7_9CHLO|mmetsp:Transcript_18152/g.39703  ORF Transcript_18152/g.39703 Transcript_18152/m.39703 type:complete len:237 (+) Transcript_18152:138-848(+)|eukprot:CAMPEP_0118926130 /NCGR_PEP_ID=MMETSP1169-20130426/3905_1 /TAXON_ID=36882 /ORGANISM="Pyramimonas obovata, Strain CCMP722" /LENGTH=236 /DNA_ID=CAMNT_0006867625 /DNA_START=138 /DNA_END=848 /DNA_ORIENTATION=-